MGLQRSKMCYSHFKVLASSKDNFSRMKTYFASENILTEMLYLHLEESHEHSSFCHSHLEKLSPTGKNAESLPQIKFVSTCKYAVFTKSNQYILPWSIYLLTNLV